MKATQKTFAGVLARALRQARVFYFCGADEAGAGDAAARVAARLGPAERIDVSGAELKRDPVRLTDEARSTSLFGDRRLVFVTTAGDEALDAIATLIADPVRGWPVLVLASGATDKSRVAKLLIERDDALVSIFYPPEPASITDYVRTTAEASGLKLGATLAQAMAHAAGLDTRIVRSEIEKLALYLDASKERPCTPTPADLAAIGTETVDDSFGPLVNAALGGMIDRVGHDLPRLTSGDIHPVGLLLAFERRAMQLAQLAARAGTAANLDAFFDTDAEARRVFFREKPELVRQLQKWRGARIERLLRRLALLHRTLLADSAAAPLRMRQAIVEIARVAAR